MLLVSHKKYIEKRIKTWRQCGLTEEQIVALRKTMEKAFIMYEKRHEKEITCES
jgi:hypothetical protein